jgi:hypothetical protein
MNLEAKRKRDLDKGAEKGSAPADKMKLSNSEMCKNYRASKKDLKEEVKTLEKRDEIWRSEYAKMTSSNDEKGKKIRALEE